MYIVLLLFSIIVCGFYFCKYINENSFPPKWNVHTLSGDIGTLCIGTIVEKSVIIIK